METNKNKEEPEEMQHESELVTGNEPEKPGILEILSGIIAIIMVVSTIWMAKILASGGPNGALEIVVTVIGSISVLLMGAASFM